MKKKKKNNNKKKKKISTLKKWRFGANRIEQAEQPGRFSVSSGGDGDQECVLFHTKASSGCLLRQ
eukprot:12910764-Prorocentrum_lima.AAC.1